MTDYLTVIEVVELFEPATKDFMLKFKIHHENSRRVHTVLMTRMVRDSSNLAEDDPEKRVSLFFSNVERDINQLCSQSSRTREDAVEMCLRSL